MIGNIIIGITIAAGLGLIIYVYLKSQSNIVINNPIETKGTVVGIEEIAATKMGFNGIPKVESTILYYPVVRFAVEAQKRVKFRNRKGYKDFAQFKEGDTVTVIYDKENPLSAKVKDE